MKMPRLLLGLCVVLAAALCVGCRGLPKHVTKVTRIQQPPPGKALVNFHRPSTWGGAALFPIFDGNGKMLIDLPGGAEFQYVCDPGEQVFMGWADHVTVVKADLAPDKVYDIVVDIGMGWVKANIMLTPVTKDYPRRARLAEFEKREKLILALNRNAHVTAYETKNQQRVADIKRDFFGGAKSDRVGQLKRDDCR